MYCCFAEKYINFAAKINEDEGFETLKCLTSLRTLRLLSVLCVPIKLRKEHRETQRTLSKLGGCRVELLEYKSATQEKIYSSSADGFIKIMIINL